MTDLEKIELAIHRVADEAGGSPFGYWLRKLAFQIAKDETARKGSNQEDREKLNEEAAVRAIDRARQEVQ